MGHAIWTPLAVSELEEILFYIAIQDKRPATGEKVYFEIQECVESVASGEFPGHVHPLAPENWFYVQFKRWLIFYQKCPQGIEVMRIIDGVRDLPQIL